MNMDIEELVTYPTNADNWIVTVGIGGVALLLSVLVVPLFLVSGYLVRAIRAGMEGATEPPAFDDWGELLTEGFIAAIIWLIYQIVPIVVFVVFVGGSVMAILTGTDAGAGAGFLGLVGGFFLAWLLSVVFGYVGVAGIANYAREGRFSAGFDFDVIAEIVTSREYLVAWVAVIVLNIAVGVITGVLNIVPILGALVSVFVTFYALPIAGWLWGDGAASAIGPQSTQDPGSRPAAT